VRLVDQAPGGDQPVPDPGLDRPRRPVPHRPPLSPDVLERGVDQDPRVRLLDLDRDVAADQMVVDLPGPFDRRLPAAVHRPLRADLDLGMDELAHRRLVAIAECGQEAASELLGGQLSTAQGLCEIPRLIAEARLPGEAEADTDRPEPEQDPWPDAELERVRRRRVESEPGA